MFGLLRALPVVAAALAAVWLQGGLAGCTVGPARSRCCCPRLCGGGRCSRGRWAPSPRHQRRSVPSVSSPLLFRSSSGYHLATPTGVPRRQPRRRTALVRLAAAPAPSPLTTGDSSSSSSSRRSRLFSQICSLGLFAGAPPRPRSVSGDLSRGRTVAERRPRGPRELWGGAVDESSSEEEGTRGERRDERPTEEQLGERGEGRRPAGGRTLHHDPLPPLPPPSSSAAWPAAGRSGALMAGPDGERLEGDAERQFAATKGAAGLHVGDAWDSQQYEQQQQWQSQGHHSASPPSAGGSARGDGGDASVFEPGECLYEDQTASSVDLTKYPHLLQQLQLPPPSAHPATAVGDGANSEPTTTASADGSAVVSDAVEQDADAAATEAEELKRLLSGTAPFGEYGVHGDAAFEGDTGIVGALAGSLFHKKVMIDR
eukprot:GHVU01083695.1.p1 GENE.GHVU01083695.1~~GHVU01083695.1.p1  ORF type:complete len:429 (-),score=79.32 GHVU01083695.1:635-1921(-)